MSYHPRGKRRPDWERRLLDYLAEVRAEPISYGHHDCLLHPAAAVRAVTGKDHGRRHRGKYRSQATAVRHLRSIGFDSPEALLDSLFPEVPIGFAQRGDLALTPGDGTGKWAIPGVVSGGDALCVGQIGLIAEPRRRWLKAWRVG